MSRLTEFDQQLHLFGGISRIDNGELTQEIQAKLDKILTGLVEAISDLIKEGCIVYLNTLAQSLQENPTNLIDIFTPEQTTSLPNTEQTFYTLLSELGKFIRSNSLIVYDQEEFAQSLLNGLSQAFRIEVANS